MAGSDKKEQQFAAREATSGGAAPLEVQSPNVSHIVMAGNPVGLIPRASLDTDQTITIQVWDGPLPTRPTQTDRFKLEIARRGSNEWTLISPELTYKGGDTWVPLVFTLPRSFMLNPDNEGAFDLRYWHMSYLDVPDQSLPVASAR
ncbi:hypothetical protein [Pseudomonas jessenii]|uniref:hypothetical protein n=1 Tax=Pseudomonas jessenii TaxID=77298 RepID=UPI0030BBF8E7